MTGLFWRLATTVCVSVYFVTWNQTPCIWSVQALSVSLYGHTVTSQGFPSFYNMVYLPDSWCYLQIYIHRSIIHPIEFPLISHFHHHFQHLAKQPICAFTKLNLFLINNFYDIHVCLNTVNLNQIPVLILPG